MKGLKMKTEQFLTKFDELSDTTAEEMRKRARILLKTGAINFEQWENNYRLPKIVACAICKTMSEQWQPLSEDDRKEIKNIQCFV